MPVATVDVEAMGITLLKLCSIMGPFMKGDYPRIRWRINDLAENACPHLRCHFTVIYLTF
jgi:hypothetical protein